MTPQGVSLQGVLLEPEPPTPPGSARAALYARLRVFPASLGWGVGSLDGDGQVRASQAPALLCETMAPMKITYLPHAVERMELRGISEDEVRGILESPDLEYPGALGRTVAERTPSEGGRFSSLAVRVIYNRGLAPLELDERIVVTVEIGRPRGARRLEEGGGV